MPNWLELRLQKLEEAKRAEVAHQVSIEESEFDRVVRTRQQEKQAADARVLAEIEAMKTAKWAEWKGILDNLGVPELLQETRGSLSNKYRPIVIRTGLTTKVVDPAYYSGVYDPNVPRDRDYIYWRSVIREFQNPSQDGIEGRKKGQLPLNLGYVNCLGYTDVLVSSYGGTSDRTPGVPGHGGGYNSTNDRTTTRSYSHRLNAFGVGVRQLFENEEPVFFHFGLTDFVVRNGTRKNNVFDETSFLSSSVDPLTGIQGHTTYQEGHRNGREGHAIYRTPVVFPQLGSVHSVSSDELIEGIKDKIAISVSNLSDTERSHPSKLSRFGRVFSRG